MTHFVHIPSPPLDRFVSAFVYYKGYVTTHSIDRYLPNGNTEILLNLAETPRYVYDNETLAPLQACKKVWVSGIREHFISIPSGTDAEMFIIEFKRGMAYPFLYHPLSEITDKVVEINGIFTEMRERLLEKATVAGKFLTAEQMPCGRFGERMIVNPFIDFAVNRIQNDPGGLTIKKIADKTGYSSKHLIRLFSDHVGVTPKSTCQNRCFAINTHTHETTLLGPPSLLLLPIIPGAARRRMEKHLCKNRRPPPKRPGQRHGGRRIQLGRKTGNQTHPHTF